MAKAYSYIRFSSPEQAQGDSLRRQLEKARAWCDARGLMLDDSLRDLGVSAYRGANRTIGALRSFLALAESGQVEPGSYLIVESLDRLSREAVIDAAARLFDLIRAGITVVTLSDGQEYSDERLRSDWTPLIVSIAVMARAHEESRIKGDRVSAAWRRKRDAAREDGRPLTHRCPAWLRLVDGRFEPIPERVEVVRRIYRMAIEGYGQRAIVKALNSEGVPAFRSSQGWQTSTLRRYLTSRTVLGEYWPHTGTHRAGTWKPEGEPIKGFYPAIIDDDTYWRAQQALTGRRIGDGTRGRGGRRGHGVAHLLQGLGKCTRCGAAMHIVNKGAPPKGGVYLECSTARRKVGCENDARWRVDDVERRLLRGLAYIDAHLVLTGEKRGAESDRVNMLRTQLSDAERRRDRLLALAESGDNAALSRFNAVAAEVQGLSRELSQAEREAAQAAADPGLKARLAETVDLSRLMEQADGDQRSVIRTRLAEQLRKLVLAVRFDPELGALAYLNPQPSVRPEHVPWIVGTRQAQAWRLWLNEDSDPHGLDGEQETTERTVNPAFVFRRK